jgi:hypothetical protein
VGQQRGSRTTIQLPFKEPHVHHLLLQNKEAAASVLAELTHLVAWGNSVAAALLSCFSNCLICRCRIKRQQSPKNQQ